MKKIRESAREKSEIQGNYLRGERDGSKGSAPKNGVLAMGGFVLAIERRFCAEAQNESVYAQGEYVQTLEGAKSPFADVVQTVMPCVVGVSNRANTFNMISGQTELIEQATGSGVVVTTQGHVVTNYHVIEGANDVQVLSQGRYLKTEIVGYDELTDLAVLRVMEDVHLPAVKMGDIAQVRVGDWAIVIGNPLGKQFADTVTVGVVSALNRGGGIIHRQNAANRRGDQFGKQRRRSVQYARRTDWRSISQIQLEREGRRGLHRGHCDGHSGGRCSAGRKQHHPIRKGDVPKLGISVITIRGSDKPTVGFIPAGVYVSSVSPEARQKKPGSRPNDIIIRMDGKRITLHTDLTNRLAARAGRRRGDTDGLSNPRPGKADAAGCDSPREELELTITLEMPSQDA